MVYQISAWMRQIDVAPAKTLKILHSIDAESRLLKREIRNRIKVLVCCSGSIS